MREIKFRAWDIERGGFLYSDDMGGLSDFFYGIEDGQFCDPEQYTGLKDKDGVDIYEGDIVEQWIDFGPGGEDQRTTVVRIDGFGCSIYEWEYKETGYLPEVIGNTHRNPELLKEQP